MTTAALIDGKAIAAQLTTHIAATVRSLAVAQDDVPGLAVVLLGDDPASQIYVRRKGEQTRAVGMRSFEHRLASTTSQAALLALIAQLNADSAVNGILVQLPLPAHIDAQAVIAAIDPDKDVDGFHPVNVGRLVLGHQGFVPCTPLGCLWLLQRQRQELAGLHAVVLGRSNIVGKPMAQLLLSANCTVTVAHSKSRDLPALCRQADLLIAAVGRPQLVQGDWIKAGATVIDVGINRIAVAGKNRLVGDVDFATASRVASALTPVPGGVGPMTIACLLHNTVMAYCRQRQLPLPRLEAALD